MIDTMKLSYLDVIGIPYSRRKKLIERKQEQIRQHNAEQTAQNNKMKAQSKRRR